MSREWYERNYISAEALWSLLDELTHSAEILRQDMMAEDNEGKRSPAPLPDLVIFGRKEMLSRIGDFLHEHEASLLEVLRNFDVDARALDRADEMDDETGELQ